MRYIWLPFRYVVWMAVFVSAVHARNSTTERLGQSLLAQQSQSTPPITTALSGAETGRRPSSDLAKLESRVQPSVIWVTVFDPKGNLLRTETGFFISPDGNLVTTAYAIEGAVNAVAKTGDGGIYNVIGVLAASKALDLAVLKADVKRVPFLEVNKNGNVPAGAGVTVVGSALAGSEGSVRETTIAGEASDRLEIAGATPASSVGAPIVNDNGEVIGVVTSAGEKTTARPAAALDSLLSRVAADTEARWPEAAEARATPRPTPRPRLVYAPAPAFPPGAALPGQSGTGRFRLTFDPQGNVTNIQVIRSTGNPVFDESAIKTLRQWKSAPSQGWQATVPVMFQTR